MNQRERYLETMLFGTPDRVPFAPGGPRESTRAAWARQGLGEGVDWWQALRKRIGLPDDPAEKPAPGPGVSFLMNPMFEEKVIEQRKSSVVVQDWKGNVCEILDCYDVTYLRLAKDFVTRRWLKLPVENREDWERMKERYDPDDPARYPEDFVERCQRSRDRDTVLRLCFHGPFWQMREWLGAEGLCERFLTDPDLVRDMVAFWQDFVSAIFARVLEHTDIDAILVSEDMAYKAHPFISPDMCREFLAPCWRQWIEQTRAGGCQVFEVDSDGDAGELIPVWIEAGFNASSPNEVAAGCDVVEYRKTYGRKMAFVGGIDKRLIAKGGSGIHDELRRIVPFMRQDEGYIPSCDHGVPPDISWENFVDYAGHLSRLTGWTD